MLTGLPKIRRSDFDVTDRIRTTDPIEVGDEVMRLFLDLYQGRKSRSIERAFKDMSLLYHGKHPDFHPCDTEYHDIQHVLDVTLAMARLLDGYERAIVRSLTGRVIPARFVGGRPELRRAPIAAE